MNGNGTGYTDVIFETVPSIDRTSTLDVQCKWVSPAWRDELADLAEKMIGPHPRYAILRWDGTAFHFQMCNAPQRIHVDVVTQEQ
jgi:hypothetical protein